MVGAAAFFGDRRVDRSYGFLHDRLVRQGPRGLSVRRLGSSRAGEVRIGRFLRHDKVTVEKIVDRAAAGTASRVAGLDVLAIRDTTGFRDDGLGNSLVGHAAIAVGGEQGALPSLVDARVIERHGGGGKGAKSRAVCGKQSQRWLDGLRASGRLAAAGAARVTAVADREGDIYEMRRQARRRGSAGPGCAGPGGFAGGGPGCSTAWPTGPKGSIRSSCRPVPDKASARPAAPCASARSRCSARRTGPLSTPSPPRSKARPKNRKPPPKRLPRLRRPGLRPPRRMDRILRKTRTRRHAPRPLPIPRHTTRIPHRTRCVNPVARKRGRRNCRGGSIFPPSACRTLPPVLPSRPREGLGEGLSTRRAWSGPHGRWPPPGLPRKRGRRRSAAAPSFPLPLAGRRLLFSPPAAGTPAPLLPSRLREGLGEGLSTRRALPGHTAAGPLPAFPASGGGEIGAILRLGGGIEGGFVR